MRNVWKGLIVGGLTGAAAGLVLDWLDWGAEAAGTLGERVIHQAPGVASKVRDSLGETVAENVTKIQAADVSGRVKDATHGQGGKVREAASDGKEKLSAAASSVIETVESAIEEGKAKAGAAAGNGKEAFEHQRS
jgi:gas vesicle protein